MHATETFARYADQFRSQPLSDEVVHHAKRAVIDWHASLFPGLDADPVHRLEAVLADDLDHGRARLARGRAATARAAALINGTAAHAAEVDDSFRDAMYHPGAATIAAALATAQDIDATACSSCAGSCSATRCRPASAWSWGGPITSSGTAPAPSAPSVRRPRRAG